MSFGLPVIFNVINDNIIKESSYCFKPLLANLTTMAKYVTKEHVVLSYNYTSHTILKSAHSFFYLAVN